VVATNPPSGKPANAPAPRPAETQKGGAQLIQGAVARPATLPESTGTAATKAPARPKTEDELVREELESRLTPTIRATDDDLRDLMQQRAQTVQKFLLDSGKVTAERLFLVAPRPVDPAAKGTPRVTFSLN
jgi:hypothetical protein